MSPAPHRVEQILLPEERVDVEISSFPSAPRARRAGL
jgi:hypothetical protein